MNTKNRVAKVWVVEAHTKFGNSAVSSFAVFKIDQGFVDMVVARAKFLSTRADAFSSDEGFPLPTGQRITFDAPSQGATFEVGDENIGEWVLARREATDPALWFSCAEGDCVSTAIPVDELAEMFACQGDHEVKVYARNGYMEDLQASLQGVLGTNGIQSPMGGADRETLKLAVLACQQEIDKDAALFAQRPTVAA